MKLMGPGSCVEGALSKVVEFIIDRYILEGAPEEEVDIKSSGRRKVSLSKEGWILSFLKGHFQVERRLTVPLKWSLELGNRRKC